MKTDDEIVREIADRIYDSFAETPKWTRQGWAAKLSPHIREGISEVRKPLVEALEAERDAFARKNPTSFVHINIVGELVTALKKIAESDGIGGYELTNIASDALAKVKEGQ